MKAACMVIGLTTKPWKSGLFCGRTSLIAPGLTGLIGILLTCPQEWCEFFNRGLRMDGNWVVPAFRLGAQHGGLSLAFLHSIGIHHEFSLEWRKPWSYA